MSVEQEPLLADSQDGYHTVVQSRPIVTTKRRFPILYTVGIITASVLASFLLLTALLVHSFIPSEDQLSQIASTAIVIQPEPDVNVLNFSQTYTTAHVQVSGAVGIDVYQALGIQPQDPSESHGAGWWESLREIVARRAINTAGPLVLHLPQAVTIFPHGLSRPLLNVTIPDAINIPLIVRKSAIPLIHATDLESRLDPFTYEIRVDLLSPKRLASLATKAWARGSIEVDIFIPQVIVRSPSESGWRKWIKVQQRDIHVTQKLDVPDVPGLPRPGEDLAGYIKLESYAFHTSGKNGESPANRRRDGKSQLRVSAVASARNPFRSVQADFSMELGFGIYLPSSTEGNETRAGLVKMADVVTMPIKLRGQDTLRINIEGVVTSDSDTTGGDDDALSGFLHNYLQGRDNNVTIRGLPVFPSAASPDPAEGQHIPPEWLHRLLPNIHAVVAFPGPQPPPKLIESVTIEQMKISESSGKLRASGVVLVHARLPPDLTDIQVDINGVRPDILVFDGEAAPSGEPVDPAVPPYPAKAFGRIHPDEYLIAMSELDPADPGVLIVRAPIHDVPIDILQGRDKVLSDFVGKIVFKGSAVAGIVGNAAVRLHVVGMNRPFEVDRLPVRGVVTVGRPRVV